MKSRATAGCWIMLLALLVGVFVFGLMGLPTSTEEGASTCAAFMVGPLAVLLRFWL